MHSVLLSLRPYVLISVCWEGWKHSSLWIIKIILLDIKNWIAREFKVPTISCGKFFSILSVWNHCYNTPPETSATLKLHNLHSFFLILTVTAIWIYYFNKNYFLRDYFDIVQTIKLMALFSDLGSQFLPIAKDDFIPLMFWTPY